MNCTDKLEIALRGDRAITHFLHTNGLITEETYDSVNDPRSKTLSPREKATLLVADIKDKVSLNPKNYHHFVGYFRENKRLYKDILHILSEEYYSLLLQF